MGATRSLIACRTAVLPVISPALPETKLAILVFFFATVRNHVSVRFLYFAP